LARIGRPQRLVPASIRRQSSELTLLDVFDVSGQLTDRQGDLIQLLLHRTRSQSAIDVYFDLLARQHALAQVNCRDGNAPFG
jgi:hypothetical protein